MSTSGPTTNNNEAAHFTGQYYSLLLLPFFTKTERCMSMCGTKVQTVRAMQLPAQGGARERRQATSCAHTARGEQERTV